MSRPLELWELSDVARRLGLSYAGARALVMRGELRTYARSRRGVRYFLPADVEETARVREETRPPFHWRRA